MLNICITQKEYNKARHMFDACADLKFISVESDERTIAHAIKAHEAFGAVLGVEKYQNELYASLRRGCIIARFGVGYDGVDKAMATQAGIFVTNTPGVLDDSVAEHAVWLMGALARNMAPSDAAIKAGLWEPHNGRELAGKMLLVIGCGRIGSKMAWIAHFGFGMHVIGYDSANLNKQNALKAGFDEIADDLALALGKADVVSLHIPSLPETKHFVNAHFLSSMKKSAFLINTARGPIIDEVALFNALATNSIAGAGLDVFGQEPYSPAEVQKDLRTLANTVLTPHIGSSTKEACDRMAASVIKNVRAAIQGHYSELDLINPEVLKGL